MYLDMYTAIDHSDGMLKIITWFQTEYNVMLKLLVKMLLYTIQKVPRFNFNKLLFFLEYGTVCVWEQINLSLYYTLFIYKSVLMSSN